MIALLFLLWTLAALGVVAVFCVLVGILAYGRALRAVGRGINW